MNILDLPPELQLHIFSFLSVKEPARIRILLTCKRWARLWRYIFIYPFSEATCLATRKARLSARASLSNQQLADLDVKLNEELQNIESLKKDPDSYTIQILALLDQGAVYHDIPIVRRGRASETNSQVAWYFCDRKYAEPHELKENADLCYFFIWTHVLWLSCTPFRPSYQYSGRLTAAITRELKFWDVLAAFAVTGEWYYSERGDHWYGIIPAENILALTLQNLAVYGFKIFCWRAGLEGVDVGPSSYYDTPCHFILDVIQHISRGRRFGYLEIPKTRPFKWIWTPRQFLPEYLVRIRVHLIKHSPLFDICKPFFSSMHLYYENEYRKENTQLICHMWRVDPEFIEARIRANLPSLEMGRNPSQSLDYHLKVMNLSPNIRSMYAKSPIFVEALCRAKRTSVFLNLIASHPREMAQHVAPCLAMLASDKIRGKKETLIWVLMEFQDLLDNKRDVFVELISKSVTFSALAM